jgi:hypothetical protein
MDSVTLIAAVHAASALLTGLVRAAEAAYAAGELTEAEIDAIRRRAAVSDAAWDSAVAAARRRLGRQPEG